MNLDLQTTPQNTRIGAVSYLNSKPLVYGLEEVLTDAEVVYQLPSQLSDRLARKELDIALVPSIELAHHPEWSITSDACIACRGPVLSVKLLFRVPPAEVRSLAVDEGSRTSAIMSQILLAELHGVRADVSVLPIGSDPSSSAADAVLIIGDRAIYSDDTQFTEVWDLGDRWCRWAELPFVFAFWAARSGVPTQTVATALSAARDAGCRQREEISREQALRMSLPRELVAEYLQQNLYFYLGPQELRGLSLFYRKAAELGFIERAPEISIDDCTIES